MEHSILNHPLPYFFPFLVLLALLEGFYLFQRKGTYDWRESLASMGVALGQQLIGLATRGVVAGGFIWLWQYRLWTIPLNQAWGWGLLFLGVEFCYYWEHRLSHTVNWFWASHSVHHSPNHYNLSMAYRLGWTAGISGASIFFVPLVLLGLHPLAIFSMLAVNLLYQFWLHTELIPKLGPLEWVLNTPSHHRVHHACDIQYLDRNYGGILIIFDRLFDSYVEETTPCTYGLVYPRHHVNPVKVAVAGWTELYQQIHLQKGVWRKLRLLFAAPGWGVPSKLDNPAHHFDFDGFIHSLQRYRHE
ncbi:sterol desaturase family protein [Ampullimonas aquatilis]|uniref:sterol desaturase family protein n=1 Tax=Ampullimonas aquatilis TaxID=1341549 RepID=UPI003C745C4B